MTSNNCVLAVSTRSILPVNCWFIFSFLPSLSLNPIFHLIVACSINEGFTQRILTAAFLSNVYTFPSPLVKSFPISDVPRFSNHPTSTPTYPIHHPGSSANPDPSATSH
nr:hypothetical protein HmN_000521100 [Hymenolepis microstoma]